MSQQSGSKPVYVEAVLKDGVLLLEFADPTSRNSLSVRAAEELHASLTSYKAQYQAVVFSARGRVFCSGGNLTDYAAMSSPEDGKRVNRRITTILDEVDRLGVPTVCAVGGDCFGGGVELVSAFSHVIAVPHAGFGLWQRRIGLTFGWGGGARLQRRLGEGNLRRLALSAETIIANEALRHGLVDAIVPEPLLLQTAEARARALARLPDAPVASLKCWSSEKEQEIFESLWWNDQHQAALRPRR